jgi:hypothetical protein
MRYIKPAVLSSSMASKSVMGFTKSIPSPDSSPNGSQVLTTAAAYESDE